METNTENSNEMNPDPNPTQRANPIANAYTDRLAQLNSSIIEMRGKLKTDIRNMRGFALLAGIPMVLAVLSHMDILPNSLWIQVPCWLIFIFFAMAVVGTNPEESKSQIERMEAIKRIYLGFPDESAQKPDYFDSLVKINVENLGAYYLLVKTHTSQSFRVSLGVCIAGFVLIAVGLAIGFQKEGDYIGYISTGVGILIEFISGALFYLYNKTVRQLKEYHDSLIEVQNILLSFKLIEGTTDATAKAAMITKMIEYLVQKK